jgi:hypothetical protein
MMPLLLLLGGAVINYYYKIPSDITVFGKHTEYLAIYNVHPSNRDFNWKLHDAAVSHAERVWLENANGVTLVKAPRNDTSWGRVDPKDFLMVKLRSRDITAL